MEIKSKSNHKIDNFCFLIEGSNVCRDSWLHNFYVPIWGESLSAIDESFQQLSVHKMFMF